MIAGSCVVIFGCWLRVDPSPPRKGVQLPLRLGPLRGCGQPNKWGSIVSESEYDDANANNATTKDKSQKKRIILVLVVLVAIVKITVGVMVGTNIWSGKSGGISSSIEGVMENESYLDDLDVNIVGEGGGDK